MRARTAGRISFVVATFLLLPSSALAQRRPAPRANDRGAIYVNGAYQAGTSDVQDTVTISANAESGSFNWKFPVKSGPALDAGGRVRVWKNVSLGAGVTTFTASGDATITGHIPHPFFFNQPRSIEGAAAAERKETVVHLRAVLTSPAGRKLQFTAFAGPAFFSVKQTLVDAVTYTDAYPFDTATFTSATTRQVSKSKIGIGIGGDAAYYFTKSLGAGVSASYAKASFNLSGADNTNVSISAGGAIIGAGVRIRF